MPEVDITSLDRDGFASKFTHHFCIQGKNLYLRQAYPWNCPHNEADTYFLQQWRRGLQEKLLQAPMTMSEIVEDLDKRYKQFNHHTNDIAFTYFYSTQRIGEKISPHEFEMLNQ